MPSEQYESQPAAASSSEVAPSEDKRESSAMVQVTVSLPAETVLEVEVIKSFFKLGSRSDAVMLAVDIGALLIDEMKRGGNIFVEHKTGQRSRLVLRRD
jgi:hypothetical protein